MRTYTALLGTISILLCACASIPKEAPELSGQLANRIGPVIGAHASF
jgi:starvation-inducible outer membrane lipoprotein